MVRKVRFQLWLSMSLLLLMLAGFASFGYWSRKVLTLRLVEQTIADNRTIGVSALGLLNQPFLNGQNLLGTNSLLQYTCDFIKLPNAGYICAVDNKGILVAFPDKKMRDTISVIQAIYTDLEGTEYSFNDFFATRIFEGYYQASANAKKEVLVAINHPQMGIKLMVHQDHSMLTERTQGKLQELWSLGLIFAVIIAGIAYFAVSKQVSSYERALKSKQRALRGALDTVADKHEELLRKHEELEMSHKEKDGLMSILAHDMRAPLNKIKGLLDITQRTGTLSVEQQLYTNMMGEIIQDSKTLINDILEMSLLESNELDISYQEIQIIPCLKQCLMPFEETAKEKGIIFIQELPSEDENIILRTDPSMLRRVIDNLVSNAIKFTFPEKKVSVVVTLEETGLHIAISDEGPGIKEEEKHLLFRKFQRLSARPTNKESSTGLGLYIVKILLEHLNGSIMFESTEGKGTTFHVRLYNQ